MHSLLALFPASLLAALPLACGGGDPAPSSTQESRAPAAAADSGGAQNLASGLAPGAQGQGRQQAQGAGGLEQAAAQALDSLQESAGGDAGSKQRRNQGQKAQQEAQAAADQVAGRAEEVLQEATGGRQDPPQQEPAAPEVELEYKPVTLDFAPEGTVKDANLDNFVVEMEVAVDGTSIGSMVFQFWPEKAPVTVRNFLRHCQEGFYNGLGFHRIMPGFMIQGGDPKGDGTGQGKYGRIKGEFSTDAKYSHVYGVISMARSQAPNSASCQFFICNASSPSTKNLDGGYASFGQLIWGKPVLDQISKVPVVDNGSGREVSKPTKKVTIARADVYRKKAWQAEEERRKAKRQQEEAPKEQPAPQPQPKPAPEPQAQEDPQ